MTVIDSEMCTIASCLHLDDFKNGELKSFKILHQVFVVCSEHESKIAKLKNAFCHICKRLGPHLHACVHCVFFGCHKHIREHAKSKKHNFTMELNYGQLHCSKCNDYVYDVELDKIALENTMSAKKCSKRVLNWNACLEIEFDENHIKPKRICITPDSTIGLRGLLNLGNTCFMNCIVQTLMHTPLLRDYFLSERHKCKGPPGACLVCELSRLFQEFYKGQRVPLALHKLLHMIWTRSKHLAEYKQQDAHEFFIATLYTLHQDCQEAMSPRHSLSTSKIGKCPCIIDQIFTGGLQSDVVCKLCKEVSTKIDPLWDFSLELGQVTVDGRQSSSLIDCLERFTQTEHLGPDFMCSNCESYQESTKQLTMKTLPIVICFHLKRFEHSNDINKKIETRIAFPEMVDMTPYMSRNKESLFAVIPADNRYSLFAVVNHSGVPSGGHYIAYVRQQRDCWYMCDDDVISRATLDEVLGSEGYLLFYHKHILGYD